SLERTGGARVRAPAGLTEPGRPEPNGAPARERPEALLTSRRARARRDSCSLGRKSPPLESATELRVVGVVGFERTIPCSQRTCVANYATPRRFVREDRTQPL